MASIDSLLDFVMPKTPHLAVDVARMELRQAAVRFCRRSGFDRRTLPAFSTVVGEPFYALTAPEGTAISKGLRVVLDGELPGLDPLRPDEVPADAATRTGIPQQFCVLDGGTRLQLIDAPAAIHSVVVTVAVEPSKSATDIADVLADRWGEEIACGALEALLVMPKMPWTDTGTAAYYKSRFDAAVSEARDEADKGFTRAPTRTRSCFGLR